MYRLQRFFDILWKSLTDRAYYRDILRASFGFSVKYLFVLLFLLSVATTLRNTIVFVLKFPDIQRGITAVQTELPRFYPEDLVINIKNGELSLNKPEPYIIDLPKDWAASLQTDTDKHLIVIDTQGKVEDYRNYGTLVLVTKTSMVYPDNSGYTVQSFSEMKEDLTIDKIRYQAFMATLKPFLDISQPFLVILLVLYVLLGPVAAATTGLLWKMLYLAFYTIAVLVVAKVLQLTYSYKELYRLSLHGLTWPILISYILSVFGIWIPFLFSMIFLVWMTFILIYLREARGPEMLPPQSPPLPQ